MTTENDQQTSRLLRGARCGVRAMNRSLMVISCVVVILLMLLTVADISFRAFFAAPIRGAIDLNLAGLTIMVFFALGYAQEHRDHIAIDIVYERLGRRGKAALRIFSNTCGLVIVLVVAWRLFIYSNQLAASHERTATWNIGLNWLALAAAIGMVALAITLAESLVEKAELIDTDGTDYGV